MVVISIRIAGSKDYDVTERIENAADSILVERLQPKTWMPAPPGSERATAPGFTLMAVEAGTERPVGFIQVLEVDGLAHLEQLSVLPRDGRRGYGRRLVEAASSEARRRGYKRITLRTFADVPWNAPFYATCGFAESEPDTDFHRRLIEIEQELRLPLYGRRIQMTRQL